jgi:tumor protein p53-inducible protein 3
MKAILVKKPGGAEELSLGEFPTPTPKDDEVLIKIKAASVNRADIMQREGKYPPPAGESPILGLDVAGVVAEIGSSCLRTNVGDSVMALVGGGGYAEYAVVPETMLMPVPKGFTFEEAASLPEAFLTAYQALYYIGNLEPSQNVLIHAGASGVGTAAIQLAKVGMAKHVIVTAGSKEKIAFCYDVGATHAINYKDGPFLDSILDITDKKGVNILLDFIGAPYFEQNLKALSVDGKMIFLAAMGGMTIDHFNIVDFYRKRIQLIGSTLRARSLDYKISLTQEFIQFAMSYFLDGQLKPVVDTIIDWHDVGDAHRVMEKNLNKGKIVLNGM